MPPVFYYIRLAAVRSAERGSSLLVFLNCLAVVPARFYHGVGYHFFFRLNLIKFTLKLYVSIIFLDTPRQVSRHLRGPAHNDFVRSRQKTLYNIKV